MKCYLIPLVALSFMYCSSPKSPEDANSDTQASDPEPIESQDVVEADSMVADQEIPPAPADAYWELIKAIPSKRPFFDDRIKYEVRFAMAADTAREDEGRRIIRGLLSWNLDEKYRPVTAYLSVTERFIDNSDEDYESSGVPFMVTIYYDTAQNIEHVDYNGLLADNTSATFWAKIDNKTALPIDLKMEAPDIQKTFNAMETGSMSYTRDERNRLHDIMITEASAPGVNSSAQSILKKYLAIADSLAAEEAYSSWFEGRLYYQQDVPAKDIYFEEGNGEFRALDKDRNLLGLLDNVLLQTGEVKAASADTIHWYYKTNDSGKQVQAKSVWPLVTIGDQQWIAVNYGYKYPQDILGSRYGFNAIDDLCPDEWHVPSQEDWLTLFEFLGGIEQAPKELISDNPMYWKYSGKAYNSTGFNIIQNTVMSTSATFLTSTASSEGNMYVVKFSQASGDEAPQVTFNELPQSAFVPCRCVRQIN